MCPNNSLHGNHLPRQQHSLGLSVIIVSWNTRDMTVACVDAARQTLAKNAFPFEIILVDNFSEDNTTGDIAVLFPDVRIIANRENLGFAKAVNEGIRASHNKFVLILNSDARFPETGFSDLLGLFNEYPRCGIAGPALAKDDSLHRIEKSYFKAYPNGWDFIWDVLVGFRLRKNHNPAQNIITRFSNLKRAGTASPDTQPFAVKALSGAFLLIRKDVFDTVGFFDGNFFFYFEDIDFCERAARSGWDIMYHPGVKVIHHHNISVNRRTDKEDLFFKSFYYYLKKRNKYMVIIVIKLIRKLLSYHSGGKVYEPDKTL
jgi:GT2 family glycosyltransferase